MKLGTFVSMFVIMMIFLEFVGIPTGLSVVLENFGVTINPTTHELVNADISNSVFYGWVFASSGILILLSVGGAIIVGLFAKSYDPSLVVLPLIISIGTLFISTFVSIISYVQAETTETWIIKLVATIFVGLGVSFVWSCVDYFTGRGVI